MTGLAFKVNLDVAERPENIDKQPGWVLVFLLGAVERSMLAAGLKAEVWMHLRRCCDLGKRR
jgi:hypothetical protein